MNHPLIEKRHSAQRRASVAGSLRHVLPPHVLSLYGSSNKRWPLVTSAAALLCSASSCAIKPWRTRKKTFCQPVRERATVHRNNWGEHFIQPLNEGFQFMRRSGYKHRAGYRSVIWKRSFDFCEKLCVSLFNKECENISFKEKNSYYYLWRRCHLNILSPREWKCRFFLWWKFLLFNYWLIISRRFCINVAELTSDVNVPE